MFSSRFLSPAITRGFRRASCLTPTCCASSRA